MRERNSMTIPDGLPTLSAGGHAVGSGFACAMEYVSVLAGEEWSDRPSCTYEGLYGMVWSANDHLPDDERHIMLPLIPRLVGARPGRMTNEEAIQFVADFDEADHRLREVHFSERGSVCDLPGFDCTGSVEGPQPACPSEEYDFLVAMLDWFDERIGRTPDDYTVTDDDVRVAARVVAALA